MALHIMGSGRRAWEWIPRLVRRLVGPQKFEEWKRIQGTAFSKRLRAKDIMAQTGSVIVVANGCFQKNMLKALKIKKADMVRPTKQQQPLFPEKWVRRGQSTVHSS